VCVGGGAGGGGGGGLGGGGGGGGGGGVGGVGGGGGGGYPVGVSISSSPRHNNCYMYMLLFRTGIEGRPTAAA